MHKIGPITPKGYAIEYPIDGSLLFITSSAAWSVAVLVIDPA
jgi:hypothetical protein